MANTTNLKLVKPAVSDKYSVGVFNDNADKIDAAFGNLQAKESANETNISNVGARVDSIIAQSGSTSGNTELNDIRLGYDNTQYKNAGAAVRGQVKDLHDQIDPLGFSVVNGELCVTYAEE